MRESGGEERGVAQLGDRWTFTSTGSRPAAKSRTSVAFPGACGACDRSPGWPALELSSHSKRSIGAPSPRRPARRNAQLGCGRSHVGAVSCPPEAREVGRLDPQRATASGGQPMNTIPWLNVTVLIIAAVVALIARKWIAGATVLAMALGLALFILLVDRWYRSRRNR